MSEFEDKLWLEVVREHGHELAARRATTPQAQTGDPPSAARRYYRRCGRNRDRGGLAARRVDQPASVRGFPQRRRHGHREPEAAIGDRWRE